MTLVVDARDDGRRFEQLAGALLARGVAPDRVHWLDARGLFAESEVGDDSPIPLPRRIRELSRLIAAHDEPGRWQALYRVVWAWRHGRGAKSLDDASDPDVRRLNVIAKAVRRDMHKMKAFVRFRRVDDAARERFVAWHRPDHRIVPLVAPFFARRFGVMRWTIFTPSQSADWDGSELRFGAGVPAHEVTASDELEQLWRSYYRAIFNPARIKLGAMVREMPTRHWATLPETSIIRQMLRDAPERVRAMQRTVGEDDGAEGFLPDPASSLEEHRRAARLCAGCDLHETACSVVFGEGPDVARVMLVGEQPGDVEDRRGRPFVGPAGQVLDRALARLGVDRSQLYVTNAVKHFHFVRRGQKRLHARPRFRHLRACRPWLVREIERVRPELVVCLGAVAAQSLFGADARIAHRRGTVLEHPHLPGKFLLAAHPSTVLRVPASGRERAFEALVEDLREVAGHRLQPWRALDCRNGQGQG